MTVPDVQFSKPSRLSTIRRRRGIFGHASVFLGPLVVIGIIVLVVPLFPIGDPNAQNLANTARPPIGFGGTWGHMLGTDQLGRDVLVRLLYGGRLSFIIALAGVGCAGLVGTTLGIVAGYLRGWTDAVITRLIDAQLALPFLLLAIAIIAARGQSLAILVTVLAVSGWAEYARVLRAETLSLRERTFTTALRASGIPAWRIMLFHILPNAMSSLVVIATLQVGSMIIGEGALSFLGLGVVAPSVSWGLMLAEGRDYLQQTWWVEVFPGLAILVVVLLTNLSGDALRAAYDSRKRVYLP